MIDALIRFLITIVVLALFFFLTVWDITDEDIDAADDKPEIGPDKDPGR